MKSFNLKTAPFLFLLLLVTLNFNACDDSDTVEELTIAETVKVNSNLQDVSNALDATGYDTTLSETGPYTLFAPVNDGFPEDSLSGEELNETIQYHILDVNLTFEDMKDAESVITLSGDSLFFSAENDTVTVNGRVTITPANSIEATNGTVFVVDTLLTHAVKYD